MARKKAKQSEMEFDGKTEPKPGPNYRKQFFDIINGNQETNDATADETCERTEEGSQ